MLEVGWWGWRSLRDLSKTSQNRGLVKAKVVHRGGGFEGATTPAPPPENFNHTRAKTPFSRQLFSKIQQKTQNMI